MISEIELEALSHAGAPKMLTSVIPGPRAQQALQQSVRFESMARGGGAIVSHGS